VTYTIAIIFHKPAVAMRPPSECIVSLLHSATPFKVIFETLCPILVEANVLFTAKGMQIISNSHVILAEVSIDAGECAYKFCYSQDSFQAQINFVTLQSCISGCQQGDTLCIQISEDSITSPIPHVCLYILASNRCRSSRLVPYQSCPSVDGEVSERCIYKYKITLLCLKVTPPDVPVVDRNVTTTIRMASTILQRVLRSVDRRGDLLQISSLSKNDKSYVAFSTSGNDEDASLTCQFEVECNSPNGKFTCQKQDLYSVRFMLLIARATQLSAFVDLYIRKDYPLGVKYTFSSGHLQFYVAPESERALDVPCVVETFLPPPIPTTHKNGSSTTTTTTTTTAAKAKKKRKVDKVPLVRRDFFKARRSSGSNSSQRSNQMATSSSSSSSSSGGGGSGSSDSGGDGSGGNGGSAAELTDLLTAAADLTMPEF